MNAPSIDIKDILESEESILGLTFTENLFIGKEPDVTDDHQFNSVTIFDTAGYPPQLALTDQGLEFPSIQIRVRNIKYLDGYELIQNIKVLLHGRAGETWNGTLYNHISCADDIAFLDWDENGNARFIINFNIQRR